MSLERFNRSLLYGVLIVLAILYLVPIYVMLITSVKGLQEITLDQMWALPKHFNLGGYQEAFKKLIPNLTNSFLLAIPATLLSACSDRSMGIFYPNGSLKARTSCLR